MLGIRFGVTRGLTEEIKAGNQLPLIGESLIDPAGAIAPDANRYAPTSSTHFSKKTCFFRE